MLTFEHWFYIALIATCTGMGGYFVGWFHGAEWTEELWRPKESAQKHEYEA